MQISESILEFKTIGKYDKRLMERMSNHYSHPKGFVGRSICYDIYYGSTYYGNIVAGSATRWLPGRHEYLGTNQSQLNNIINNVFFNVSPPKNEKYPIRNFTSYIVRQFVSKSSSDWETKYGDVVLGFETLVEKPRTGELYIRAGWQKVGETAGYSCKRIAGNEVGRFTGRRVWNTNKEELKPKNVFCFRIKS